VLRVAKVRVLAENQREFRRYIDENNLNLGHFEYVGVNIRGVRGAMITVGKWWRNPNYRNEEFAHYLSMCVNAGLISLIPAIWGEEYQYQLLR
jgi:hypothetical protein